MLQHEKSVRNLSGRFANAPSGNRSASTSFVVRSPPRVRARPPTPRRPRSRGSSPPSASSTSATGSRSSAARPRRSRTRLYVSLFPQEERLFDANTRNRASTPRSSPSALPRPSPSRPMPASVVPAPCASKAFGSCQQKKKQGERGAGGFLKPAGLLGVIRFLRVLHPGVWHLMTIR